MLLISLKCTCYISRMPAYQDWECKLALGNSTGENTVDQGRRPGKHPGELTLKKPLYPSFSTPATMPREWYRHILCLVAPDMVSCPIFSLALVVAQTVLTARYYNTQYDCCADCIYVLYEIHDVCKCCQRARLTVSLKPLSHMC